jgi:hypothetical protein
LRALISVLFSWVKDLYINLLFLYCYVVIIFFVSSFENIIFMLKF